MKNPNSLNFEEKRRRDLYETVVEMHPDEACSKSWVGLQSAGDWIPHNKFSNWAIHHIVIHAQPMNSKPQTTEYHHLHPQ